MQVGINLTLFFYQQDSRQYFLLCPKHVLITTNIKIIIKKSYTIALPMNEPENDPNENKLDAEQNNENAQDQAEQADNVDNLNQSGQKEQAQQNKAEQKSVKLDASKVTLAKGKEEIWKAYDFLFPGGKLAKLIKIGNIYKKNLPIREMLEKFKYNERLPVVNLIGAMEKGRGKFYAGIVRAAFNTDAVIVDNGLSSGIEKFALRRGVKFIGIAPEGEIKFPKINPSQVDPLELANGHTHLFLVNNPSKDLSWGGETSFKISVCLAIAQGKNRPKGVDRCKIVSIIMGDSTFDIIDQIKLCVENQIPLIVVPGSPICDEIIRCSEGEGDGELAELVKNGHFFYCNSTNSEDIAQLTHLMLSITPW